MVELILHRDEFVIKIVRNLLESHEFNRMSLLTLWVGRIVNIILNTKEILLGLRWKDEIDTTKLTLGIGTRACLVEVRDVRSV